MPSASRVTRSSLATAEDLASLSARERLVFSQAVYEYGAGQSSWSEIAKLLSKHPLVSRPKSFFTPQSCVIIYNYLMKEAELEYTVSAEAMKATVNLHLAQFQYDERTKELRDEIAAEEERFKTLVTEIDEIRSGKWDQKIQEKLNGVPTLLDTESPVQQLEDIPTLAEPEPTEEKNTPQARSQSPTDASHDSKVFSATQAEDSDGEAPMDVSSPVRGSSPVVSKTSAEEPEDKKVENAVEDDIQIEKEDVVQDSLESERESLADFTPHSRPLSTTPKAQSEREHSSSSQMLVLDDEDTTIEQDAEQAGNDEQVVLDVTTEVEYQAKPAAVDEEILGQSISREGESQEVVSHGSTPSPQEKGESKREVSEVDGVASDSSRDKKRLREESEPADDAESPATPSAMASGFKNTKERKRFQNVINMLHSQISTHRNGTIFHHPIKPSEAPDYRDIVKRPMDLKTIKNRVRDGVINTSSEYQRDIYLMFANSLMYNRPNSDIYVMAEEMMLDSEAHINSFRQTEVFNARTRI